MAAAAAGILTTEGHDGAIYNATGPASLSGEERAAAIAAIAGRPVNFAILPEEQLRGGMAQMGLPDAVVDTVISIQRNFAEGAFDIVTGDVERLSGRAPRPLGDVLENLLRAQV